MSTAQINVRLDAALKGSGDRSLATVGYTPTRAVRSLWEFASRNAHDRKKLRAILSELEGNGSCSDAMDEADSLMQRIEEGPLIFERALHEMGIDDLTPIDMTDEELRAQAYREKWEERGLS